MISRRRWPSLTYLAGVLALAACSDSPAPLAPSARGAKAAAPTGAQVGDRNLVMFRSQTAIPSDFPGRVKALGGKVEAAYQGAGIATVTGLTDAAASKLARASDVAVVMKDFEYRVDDVSSEA